MLKFAVAVPPAASVACTVKLNVPDAEGMPEMVFPERDNPPGRAPALMLHVYGVTPPVAARLVEYEVPTVAPGREVVLTASAGFTVMLKVPVAVAFVESFTCAVKFAVPLGPVGVPLIAPVLAFSVSPAGKLPTVMLQVYGGNPPLAPKVVPGYTSFTAPVGSVAAVTVSGPFTIVMLSACVALCAGLLESTTFTVKLNTPVAVGLPLIAPVEAFCNKPVGNAPAEMLHVNGPCPPLTPTFWL